MILFVLGDQIGSRYPIFRRIGVTAKCLTLLEAQLGSRFAVGEELDR